MPNKVISASGPFHFRIIGLLLIVTLVMSTIIYHDITNIFWLCNISTLFAGVALLFGKPQSALIGATYMILGLICWLLNVIVNNTFGDTISYISHFCFAGLAVYLFIRIPVGRYLWLGCLCWYILAQVLSRLFTPPSENINLAFSIWPGWDTVFTNFFSFWCFMTLSCLFFLFVMNTIIFKLQRAHGFVLTDNSK
jgi:hypothetical protein